MSVAEAAQLTAREVLTRMGMEFNKLREENKVKAWKMFQRRLNENFGLLCELMSPKDLTELSLKIENDIKSESGSSTGGALDQVREFLSGKVAA
jgi:hypothetical protein